MYISGGRLKLCLEEEVCENPPDDKTSYQQSHKEQPNKTTLPKDHIEIKMICDHCGCDRLKTVLNLESFYNSGDSPEVDRNELNDEIKEILNFISTALQKKRTLNVEDYLTESVEMKLLKLKKTLLNGKHQETSQQIVPFNANNYDKKNISIESISKLFEDIFCTPSKRLSLLNEEELPSLQLCCNDIYGENFGIEIKDLVENDEVNDKVDDENSEEEDIRNDKELKNTYYYETFQGTHEKQDDDDELDALQADPELHPEEIPELSEENNHDVFNNETELLNQHSEMTSKPAQPERKLSPNKMEIKAALSKFRECVETFLLSDDEMKNKKQQSASPSYDHRPMRRSDEKIPRQISPERRKLQASDEKGKADAKTKKQKDQKKTVGKKPIHCATGAYAPVTSSSIINLPLSNKSFYTSIFGGAKGPKQKTIFNTNSKLKESRNFDRSNTVNRCTILETISDCKEEESSGETDRTDRSDHKPPSTKPSKKTLHIKIPSVESCSGKHINRNINHSMNVPCQQDVDQSSSFSESVRRPSGSRPRVKNENKKIWKDEFELEKYEIDNIAKTKTKSKAPKKRVASPARDHYVSSEALIRSPPKRFELLAQPKQSYLDANNSQIRKKRLGEIEGTPLKKPLKKKLRSSDSYTTSESLVDDSIKERRKTTDKETLNDDENVSIISKYSLMIESLGSETNCHEELIFDENESGIDVGYETSVDHIDHLNTVDYRHEEILFLNKSFDIDCQPSSTMQTNIDEQLEKDALGPSDDYANSTATLKNKNPEETYGVLQTFNGAGDFELNHTKNELFKFEKSVMNNKKDFDSNHILIKMHGDTFKKYSDLYTKFWPPVEASPSFAQAVSSTSFCNALPVQITVAYAFLVPNREHNISTELLTRNIPANNALSEQNSIEPVVNPKPCPVLQSNCEAVAKSFEKAKINMIEKIFPSTKTAETTNKPSVTVCIQTMEPTVSTDKNVFVDFPEREYVTACVNVQSAFMKPEYLKNHPSLERLFMKNNITKKISKITSKLPVKDVESHPLIEMFRRNCVKPKRRHRNLRLSKREVKNKFFKKNSLLVMYVILFLTVFAALTYPDILILTVL